MPAEYSTRASVCVQAAQPVGEARALPDLKTGEKSTSASVPSCHCLRPACAEPGGAVWRELSASSPTGHEHLPQHSPWQGVSGQVWGRSGCTGCGETGSPAGWFSLIALLFLLIVVAPRGRGC